MSGPDRTSRIARALREIDARQPRFVWPAPPYFEYDGEPPPQGEPCLLTFTDGGKAAGLLQNFVPDHEVLKFQAENGKNAQTVAFSSLVTLQLLDAVRLEVHTLPGASGLHTPSERQPFSVTLADGSLLEGETMGHVEALCGLFLFVPQPGAGVVRWFVPGHAVRERRLGKPLGEMLIDEQAASPETITQALERQKLLRARRFGEYLTANQIVSHEQLAAALKAQEAQPSQKLGETLVELGYLTKPELAEALTVEARNRTVPLGRILADMGVVDIEVVHNVLAKQLGIPVVDLGKMRPSAEALKRIPAALANRYQVLPLAEADGGLVVAVDDPTNMERMEEVRFLAGSKLIAVVATAREIRQALELAYGPPVEDTATRRVLENVDIGELRQRLTTEGGAEEAAEQQAPASDSTLVRLVNKMIVDAVEQKASDIHIEVNPAGKNVRVRFRKDGLLVNYLEIPARFRSAMISRLKIMSQLDISERRKPQDGKIDFKRVGPLEVELRIATIPTANGLEDVVMRVLAAATPKPIDELGFDAESLAAIKGMMSRPHGLFLVCGPTGSGKTTTLHSLLGFLNTPDIKIWTAEDPIEITQAGLRQVQMNPKIGWTFATAMRSFMRADPDVIMVGEMRDAETTKIGIEASLTGHLVLSTLHTNSAAESVVRLLDLGMDPFNFADALLGVLAQRLVRKLCLHCRAKHEPSVREMEALATEYCEGTRLEPEKALRKWRHDKVTLYQAKGCKECDRTGYKGRLAVYELMVADPAVKRLIQTRSPIAEIAAAAAAHGMRTLKQDGMDKVMKGHTDMQQVRAV
ncbi:MAG TPA: ATPase, T2SS/T4P/T4SS family [Burkholderiales bacterium]|nr:ATPase, T2SS/T4P/T4SS family [Burkholderiales bacterium]